ncbi:MAG: TIGR00725 family protein [Anaerolineae bacterium]
MPERKPVVAVIGGADCTTTEEMQAAYVGRLLAEHDAILICGGRGGVMEAACGGAKAGGGLTIGVLPGDDANEANPYVDVAIVTGMGEARNAIITSSADGVIAIGGGYGTLAELAFALKRGIPVVGLGTWKATAPDGQDIGIQVVASAEDAVKTVMDRLRRKP